MKALSFASLLEPLKALPYGPVLIAMMLIRLIVAGIGDPAPDEAYYWLWAQHPAAGYYDHPPMVAWLIGLFTSVFSDSVFVVRLPFVLCFAGISVLVFDAARVMFSEAIARRATLWLNASLLLSAGIVIATPDPPSVLMWTATIWALARLVASGDGRWWLVAGLMAGLGVEAKYTNLFLGPGIVLWLSVDTEARRWWRSVWLYLGGGVALLAALPNLLWNAGHGWVSFLKQFGRIGGQALEPSFLLEALFSQALLFNPLVLAFAFLGGLAAFSRPGDTRLRLLMLTSLPLLAYIPVHALHDRVQGNWPAPVYPALILLAAVVAEGITDKAFDRARALAAPVGIGLSLAALGVIAAGAFAPLKGHPMSGWRALASELDARRSAAGAAYVATTDYNLQGQLTFHLGEAHITPLAERVRYGWLDRAPEAGAQVLVVTAKRHQFDLSACVKDLEPHGEISRAGDAKSGYLLFSGTLTGVACEAGAIDP